MATERPAAPVGAGGMGEVYEATDTRLDRVVAVKVVRAELAGDADRRARFLREARAIAGLTHPHICPCTTSARRRFPGTPQPVDFLVMERLTGQNLAERPAPRRPCAVRYLETTANERWAQLSPDGKWMAYLSDQGGRAEVFVRPFLATDTRWQVSQGGARQLVWHPDGDRLLYVSRDRKLVAVDLRSVGTTLSVGASRVVADTRVGGFERGSVPMAVGRDGRVLLGTAREGVQPVTVVLNWQAARADQE